jgi:tRNA dimethylallyltransferase
MRLREKLSKLSNEQLFERLLKLDPRRAEKIDRNNPVRLIRAVELATLYGPVSPIITSSPYDMLWIGLKADNEKLKERINLRLTKRLRSGMIAEFKRLHKGGLSLKRMEELGLEYRYGARLLQGQITRAEFVEQLSREIFHYAKRQMTWFKRNKEIHWLEMADTKSAEKIVETFLKI